MKLAHIKGFAGAAAAAAIACAVLAGCSSASSEAPSLVSPSSPAPSAPGTQAVLGPASPRPAVAGLVEVRIHPGEAFFVIAPDPDIISARGLSRTVAMHEADPSGVVAEWVVS
ncbi:MAG: hypothetical protein PSX37_03100, partial [bacterium]|nr:hypothetical protein [bacterium]